MTIPWGASEVAKGSLDGPIAPSAAVSTPRASAASMSAGNRGPPRGSEAGRAMWGAMPGAEMVVMRRAAWAATA